MNKQNILVLIILVSSALSFFFLKNAADDAKDHSNISWNASFRITEQNPKWYEDSNSAVFKQVERLTEEGESYDRQSIIFQVAMYLVPLIILIGGLFHMYRNKEKESA